MAAYPVNINLVIELNLFNHKKGTRKSSRKSLVKVFQIIKLLK